jgi:hypothetical protein
MDTKDSDVENSKRFILKEIRRTAEKNGGVPLGMTRFYQATGIKIADWRGKLWLRWSDAVKEAGLPPQKAQKTRFPLTNPATEGEGGARCGQDGQTLNGLD